jgi:hypothetical protein
VERTKRPWQLLSSPEERLDYALLRLEKPAGVDLIDGAERGFLTPTSSDFNAEDRLLILQHSNAAPLKLAIGTVDSLDPPSHVHYKVNCAIYHSRRLVGSFRSFHFRPPRNLSPTSINKNQVITFARIVRTFTRR